MNVVAEILFHKDEQRHGCRCSLGADQQDERLAIFNGANSRERLMNRCLGRVFEPSVLCDNYCAVVDSRSKKAQRKR